MQEDNAEISFKELLLKIGAFFKFLFSKWIILLIAGAIGATIGWLIAGNITPTYTGKLTFVLSSESKSGGLSALASQFGFDVGGSQGNNVFSGDNILTLFKSQRMIKAVLFKKPPESNENLANIIIREWEWDKKWMKKERTKHEFPFPADISKLTPVQDSLLREIYDRILDKNLAVSRTDKKLSVYDISTEATNEIFACYLTRYLMDETAKFYIETKTSLAKLNLQMLQREADSLQWLLGSAISSTSAETDRTFALNPAMQTQRAPAQKGQVRATVLATAYGEVVRNLELAKITLQKETPLYQIIDEPEIPLKVKKANKIFALLAGAILMIGLAIVYLTLKRIVRK